MFSIATPAFNGLPWLRACVASIRDQGDNGAPKQMAEMSAFPAVEHLIQDAHSEDSEGFAREVGADFFRDGTLISHSTLRIPNYSLAIYSERDEGMYDAINRAWARSAGEILSYLNCDEQYLPGTLKRVADEFRRHPETDIVFGDAIVISAQGEPLSYRRIVRPSAIHTRIVHLGTMSCSMFFRRKLFDDGIRFDTKWRAIGDAEWVCNALARQPVIRMIREPLAAFTLTGNNLGGNAKALAEASAWRASAPKIHRTLAPVWKGLHGARKLLAGAYSPKNLETALYHPKGSKERIAIRKKNLSFHWPSATD